MAMKQTQTKLFDFSDAGLDFCAGSKNLFPDRFKKMLALGYNEQTVSSVVVAGNQVTLTYGVSHGYVADRVLKVNAPELLSINDGEFVIDSVTENAVTMTIDGAPASITGNFTTKVASLGWSLEYENANIQIYKFKQLDESDIYIRLCYQDVATRRNAIAPCVGKTFDPLTGFITDPNAYTQNAQVVSPGSNLKFDFDYGASSPATRNEWTYSQGLSTYGKANMMGSKYHFAILTNCYAGDGSGVISAVLPNVGIDNEKLQYPVLIGKVTGITTSISSNALHVARAYVGNIDVAFDSSSSTSDYIFKTPQAATSFISAELDIFNTTTAQPIFIYEKTTRQHLGVLFGVFIAKYSSTNAPSLSANSSPFITKDIDLDNSICIHHISNGGSASQAAYMAFPLEEVKIVS
ncbi:hypothetical protein F906_01499 [Acinetobacter pseudolwoffii]|uniref:Uncharacterized protein n=1 Tax=Acinetobacter pseudolwoffii TaxID=2053287 RepID=N9M7X3_9GAMM|nr:hypothetical protein [Acinetobacter pseudolwoffii]ENW86444.1 hypothetical protein F906_01499 [Acinetobacter pseudolwoffii]